jgi:ATP-dependent helicase/nuclease subunit A
VSFVPVDEAARARARHDHGTSLVLEAGAGTGKTTLLVDRIEALVRSGRATLDEVAAVTFTENAATTMKLRLRERLERARADEALPPGERARAGAALEALERASISTIHALCAALLAERPLECGVAPGFRVADEAETDRLFGEAWEEWLSERLITGDETLLLAVDQGIPLSAEGWGERTSLRGLARALLEQRDLAPRVAEGQVDARAWLAELQTQAARGAALAAQAQEGDTLKARLEALLAFAEQARFLQGRALADHLVRIDAIPRNFGHRPRWPSTEVLEEARAVAAWTSAARTAWGQARSAALHGQLVRALQGVVAAYERKKREHGLLDFLDLLLKARDALRDHPALREYFRARYPFVIVDEFQDTDPVQVDVIRHLAGDDPGRLAVVGDAKQSIYRFRRAEIALFRELSAQASTSPGWAVLQLTQNFRSRPAILRFVNRVFAELIQESAEAGQPPYEPIAPPPGLAEEPSVLALRFEAPYAQGEELLQAEADALSLLIAEAARGRYSVRDPLTGETRASRAGDVMVLTRRFTQVRHLEDALLAAGVRFTVEGGKSFFDRQEVHEALAVLKAAEDPSDRVSLVAALRSSFLGVSDRDIVSYAVSGAPLRADTFEEGRPGARALAPALGLLKELHALRTRVSVPELLERLYDRTRILAALSGTRRGEAQVANLEKVVALARAAREMGALTLRGFTRLLSARIQTAREEPDLPATRPGDPATVRILSVHKAKGLEAPIVALYDAADDYSTRTEAIPVWADRTIAVGFRKECQPPGWDALVKQEEARAWAEGRRLLYVACTRARDLLIIPRPPGDARPGSFWRELTSRLPTSPDADVAFVDAATLPRPDREETRVDLRELAAAEGGDAAAARWEKERRELLEAAAHRPLVPMPVTSVAARQAPPSVFAPGSVGGRDFGSLVHRLLEWVPLTDDGPARLAAMAAAIAPSFGLGADAADRAAAAAARVLALPLLERARRAKHLWRELHVWFPEGSELVEGLVDLVFEEDGGLVIADYKTDHVGTDQALAQAAHHAPQLQLYGRGLAQATGLSVRERLVVFTALGQAVAV